MNKEENEPFNIRFKPSYHKKVEDIVKLTGRPRTEVYNEIFEHYFKDKIVTNDFIELEEPFYFNMAEIKEKGNVKATTKPSIHDLEKVFTVNKIPNNVDSFDKDLKTYYSGNPSEHLGIYVDFIVEHEAKEIPYHDRTAIIHVVTDISERYFIFSYNSSDNTLDISLVPFENLYLYVPTDSTVLEELEEEKDKFYYNIILDNETKQLNDFEYFEKSEVIQSYKAKKDLAIYFEKNKEKYDRFKEESEKFEEKYPVEDLPDFLNMSGADLKEYYIQEKKKDKDFIL